ncbi:hypothetical protein HJFPF1_02826 [Paramyrothecium foliicola]|nr:hypothetical protein HJFPF1_02826 [Paramyrothecium foliicola]
MAGRSDVILKPLYWFRKASAFPVPIVTLRFVPQWQCRNCSVQDIPGTVGSSWAEPDLSSCLQRSIWSENFTPSAEPITNFVPPMA